jgi:5-methylcytosine-specific restriction protein A
VSNRKPISAKERLRLFALHGGVCHLCRGKITATREAWEVSHDIPLEMGGADDDDNRKLAHFKCHRAHTATVDLPLIAKAKRREQKNLGARKPKHNWASRPFNTSYRPR